MINAGAITGSVLSVVALGVLCSRDEIVPEDFSRVALIILLGIGIFRPENISECSDISEYYQYFEGNNSIY